MGPRQSPNTSDEVCGETAEPPPAAKRKSFAKLPLLSARRTPVLGWPFGPNVRPTYQKILEPACALPPTGTPCCLLCSTVVHLTDLRGATMIFTGAEAGKISE